MGTWASAWASSAIGAVAAFGLAGTAFGLGAGLSILAQLRVPSGMEGFCASATGGGAASEGVTISHEASGEVVFPWFASSFSQESAELSAGISPPSAILVRSGAVCFLGPLDECPPRPRVELPPLS